MITKSISPQIDARIDDDRLAAEVKQDRPGAFLALYDRYLTPVYHYLYRRVGDVQTAEDLTTQVFLTALERFEQYRGGGKFAAWLFTIARNKSIDHFRAARREISLESCPVRMLIDEDGAFPHDEAWRIQDLIARRSAHERELLDLRFAADMTFAEMARVLQSNENTVKKQVYRLLARLKNELENEND